VRPHPSPGRPSTQYSAQVLAVVANGSEVFGVLSPVWTIERVAQSIPLECGVRVSPAHGSGLLHCITHTYHTPIHNAISRDEDAIQRWKCERVDARKQRPPTTRAPRCSVGEAGWS
jgi:transposase